MKAIKEVGLKRAWRFFYLTLLNSIFNISVFPPIRTFLLKLYGAKIGKNVVIHRIRFFNCDRTGFKGLTLADNVFIGDECLFDLAESIQLDEHVTLAERVLVLTHMNVGYQDHPLQARYPSVTKGVHIHRGSFIGANATLLAGVEVGEESLIAAGSMVRKNVASKSVVGGVPAKPIKETVA